MSDFSDICDSVITDAQDNVAALADVQTHRYEPWDPEKLDTDGLRHLAVWPIADGPAEDEGDLQRAIGFVNLAQHFSVLVWEPSGWEESRQVSDEAGAKNFLEIAEDLRDRFIGNTLHGAGGAWKLTYMGTQFAGSPGAVRWFALTLKFDLTRPGGTA